MTRHLNLQMFRAVQSMTDSASKSQLVGTVAPISVPRAGLTNETCTFILICLPQMQRRKARSVEGIDFELIL